MEVTVRFLKMENPNRFINVTRVLLILKDFTIKLSINLNRQQIICLSFQRGSVGIWSKNFKMIKNFQIMERSNRQIAELPRDSPIKRSLWIQDAVITESNKICVSTSKRNLRFFNISSENFNEEFSIYALPTNPNCLDYYFEVN